MTIAKLKNTIKSNREERAELVRKGVIKDIVDISELFFKTFPEINKFAVIGITPEWNDGEECLHRCGFSVGHIKDNDYDTELEWNYDIVNFFYPGQSSIDDLLYDMDEGNVDLQEIHVYTKKITRAKLKPFAELVEEAVKDHLPTNFLVTFDRDGGSESVKIVKTEPLW